jgi:hypothetical protein
VTPTQATSIYWRGMQAGYRLAGRSLLRRFMVTFVVTAILWGASIALLWESADVLSRMTTGEPASVVVIGKIPAWLRIKGR